MDNGMDKKQLIDDECSQLIAAILQSYDRSPRYLRTHFDEIQDVFDELQ